MKIREKIMRKNIVYLFLIFQLPFSLHAQSFDAAGLSMGRAYGALATGIDAIAWNPANLTIPRKGSVDLNIFALNFNLANSGFSLTDYNRYFTEEGHNGWWSAQDKQDIMDIIGDDPLKIYGDFNTNVLGIAVGNYAFAVQGVGNMLVAIPQKPFELFLFGNQDKDIIQRFADLDANGYGAVKVSLAISHPIEFKKYFDSFGIGINFNYYRGFQYVKIDNAEGFFNATTSEIKSKMNIKGRRADGGSGFGIDIGGAGIMKEDWTVSLALQNVFAGINWNDNPEAFRAIVQVDSGDLKNADEITTSDEDTVYSIDEFSRAIPLVVHAGAAYQWRDNWVFSADIEKAFGRTMGYTERVLLSFGTEFKPIEQIPLRAGFTIGGKWGFLFGMGFGIHAGVFEFDLGYSMHRALWPTFSTGNSLALNIKLVF